MTSAGTDPTGNKTRRKKGRDGAGSIFRRGNIWWVKIYDRDGEPISQSSGSTDYEDAKKLLQKMQGEKARGEISGGAPDKVRISELLDDVLESDIEESTRKVWRLVVEKNIRPFFGEIKAARLTTEKMKAYRKKRLGDGRSDATANRELSILRTAYHNGRKLTPPKVLQVPYFPMIKETTQRTGFLSDEQYVSLRDALPKELKLLFVTDYLHGIRRSELLSITWPQVDFEQMVIRMPGDKEKNREGRTLPIVPGNMEDLLHEAWKERRAGWPHSPWVFNRKGKPIKDFRGSWDSAVRRAGIKTEDGRKLNVHDLRRTSVRNMRRDGTPQVIRMKISGHKTDSMERRYNISDDEDIRIAGEAMAKRMQSLAKARSGESSRAEGKRESSKERP
jgi:integrase/recombinase XerD